MNIQKADGMNAAADKVSGKAAPAPSAHNSALKMPPAGPLVQAQTVKTPVTRLPANSLPSLIAAAGLPADKLSASIISFARFFSLPLKPELMASIRRQGVSPLMATLSPEDSAKSRETFSLAAAAAEGKGIELRPKGLELFVEAINPDLQRRHDSEERKRDRQNKGQTEQENPPKASPLSASGLKEIALESAEKDPLLAILNRLPGKNGQRWVVLPFSFCEFGRKYRISLRILLETDKKAPDRAVCIAMDITEGADDSVDDGSNPNNGDAKNGEHERRWSFVLAGSPASNPAEGPAARLTVFLQPELSPKAIEPFARELAHLMGMPPEHVFVKSRAEVPYGGDFPCELGDEGLLRSINEAV